MTNQPKLWAISTKAENERLCAMINAAWGERVAWVEDREQIIFGDPVVVPTLVSRLVAGKLEGRSDVPPFFAGPAPSMRKLR